ncbi:NUDIX hydrolase [Caldibacillus lycopersici]|uniref:NUDIX hydrolase n=1 Tax=Perspicuibacillus lycopersici TaxID=1325689 RepID=A0AAE3IUD5_9BACI|nr:NUDIX hydrolase [Perspicuibacillus lycopersici]MCU9613773.1 NUDIX hydrolase [Perspicuibacillus lycopersici]
MQIFEEKTISSKKIFDGRVIQLQVDEVLLPNGKTSTREIVKHPGAVAVIAITDEGKMIMVEQYRKPLERTLIEIPAGKLEQGELPERSAARELEEETGYSCTALEHLTSFYTSPGFANELLHIYKADGLKLENRLHTDEDEFVNVLEVTFEEAQQMVAEQKIYDAKTVYAVQYWQMLKTLEK